MRLPHFAPLIEFIFKNPDTSRQLAKGEQAYFVNGGFDPVLDLNVEFLFRAGMDHSGLPANEKIPSVRFLFDLWLLIRKFSFEKVSGSLVSMYRIPSRTNFEYSQQKRAVDVDIKKAEKSGSVADGEIVQRKIQPWQEMIQNDTLFLPEEELVPKVCCPFFMTILIARSELDKVSSSSRP